MWIGGSKFENAFCLVVREIMIFFRYVDSHPPWAKKLEAHLAPGIHTILFKARSPNSNLNDVCRTILTVKGLYHRHYLSIYLIILPPRNTSTYGTILSGIDHRIP